jgi:cytochrome c-type biogenesis protein CcmE
MAKRLDDELRDLVGQDDDAPGVARQARPAASAPAASKPNQKRNVGLLVTLLVMMGALLTLVFVGFKDSAVYAVSVDKLTSEKGLVGRKVRVQGVLVPGTLTHEDKPCKYEFRMKGEQAEMPVNYAQCVIPDTFRDVPQGGVEVTVEGELNAKGGFEASLVMAKCASKYDPKKHEMSSL